MARLKTAYRSPVEQPPDVPKPSEKISVEIIHDEAAPDVAAIEPADEATETLKRQIEHLRTSEELQRRHAQMTAQQMAQQAQRPMSREEKLEAWRASNGDPDDIAYLEAHPLMIDRHDVTVVAAEEAAQQGFERGTDAHREATREIFHRHLGHRQAAPAASPEPTPLFFAPPPQPQARAEPSALYSAPVSRQAQSGGTGQRPARQVTLTPQEQEYARVAGVTDVEYARQKQRLAQAKANGDYGERR